MAEEKAEKMEIDEGSGSEADLTISADFKEATNLFRESVRKGDARVVQRAVGRVCWSLRKRFTSSSLSEVFATFLDTETNIKFQKILTNFGLASIAETKATEPPSDDVVAYLCLAFIVFLIDQKDYTNSCEISSSLVNGYCTTKKSAIAPLQAQIFFYFSRSHELVSESAFGEIRSTLLSAFQTATLRHEIELRSVLLNLILRNSLHFNLYDSADKIVSRADIKEGDVSSNQYARFMYYVGRIKAIQLRTQESKKYLQIALRKAPLSKALGFRLAVSKLLIIVELSLGLIPDRSLFNQDSFRAPLKSYFELAQAVRRGDTVAFRSLIEHHSETFRSDNTLSLVQRLYHNVIKAGLRRISVAYSRISIADICKKLCLDDVQEAEFMVAKAIRDDVIVARIAHDPKNGNYLQSKETVDVYSTQQPQEAFHDRIQFYLQVYNDSVRAMRFPNTHKKIMESEEDRKERVKAEQELPTLMDEDDDALG